MCSPHGPQRGLGEGDGAAVVAEEQRLGDQQGDDIAAEPPVAAGLGEPQRLMEVALGESMGVGVVGADARHRHQSRRRPVQAPAHGVAVAAAQQRRGLRVEEADDPGPGRDAARLAIHLLVVVAGRLEHRYVGRADPARSRPRYVGVLRGVLPLPDRHHRRSAGDGGHGGQVRAPLFVGAPQGGGPLDEPGEGGALSAVRPRLGARAHADVVEPYGPPQTPGQHLADQVGHLPARALALEPAGDRRVFVPQAQPTGPARPVDVTGEARTGHTGLLDQGFEQDIGLHRPPRCVSQ